MATFRFEVQNLIKPVIVAENSQRIQKHPITLTLNRRLETNNKAVDKMIRVNRKDDGTLKGMSVGLNANDLKYLIKDSVNYVEIEKQLTSEGLLLKIIPLERGKVEDL